MDHALPGVPEGQDLIDLDLALLQQGRNLEKKERKMRCEGQRQDKQVEVIAKKTDPGRGNGYK